MASIYVVEDEGITASQVKNNLEDRGYEVPFLTPEGQKAVEKVRDHPPDLVLMDVKLGDGMGGLEAARKIIDSTDVPVLFMTAYGDEETLDRVRESGGEGLVLKPLNWDEVDNEISSILREDDNDDSENPSRSGFFSRFVGGCLGRFIPEKVKRCLTASRWTWFPPGGHETILS